MSRIGLIDVDGGKTFPNLALMKNQHIIRASVMRLAGITHLTQDTIRHIANRYISTYKDG
jgi:hypothetical protein